MSWTKGDLKIFATGLAIGGKWDGKNKNESFDMAVMERTISDKPIRFKNAAGSDFNAFVVDHSVMGEPIRLGNEAGNQIDVVLINSYIKGEILEVTE